VLLAAEGKICLQLMRQSQRKSVLSSKTALWTLKLHLPGFEEAQTLAVALSELADSSGRRYIVPLQLRTRIMEACGRLHEHDKSASNFVKKYESRWGQTLFGRCLGHESSQSRAYINHRFLSLKLTLFRL